MKISITVRPESLKDLYDFLGAIEPYVEDTTPTVETVQAETAELPPNTVALRPEQRASAYPIEVQRRQYEVLQALVQSGRAMHRNALAQQLGLEPNQVSNRLNKLQERGLVERVMGSWTWGATAKARERKLIAV